MNIDLKNQISKQKIPNNYDSPFFINVPSKLKTKDLSFSNSKRNFKITERDKGIKSK